MVDWNALFKAAKPLNPGAVPDVMVPPKPKTTFHFNWKSVQEWGAVASIISAAFFLYKSFDKKR